MLFHRVANTLNYLDIKTVVVSCGTCYDQLQGYQFDKIFPGCRIVDIHEYLLEKGITLGARRRGYLYHDPCHSPMKLQEPMKTVKALVGAERDREQALLRRERHAGRDAARHLDAGPLPQGGRVAPGRSGAEGVDEGRRRGRSGRKGPMKILTSCPSCLQGLSRFSGDLANGLLEADYIVVEMANQILGPDWMPDYVARANAGGIERVLV